MNPKSRVENKTCLFTLMYMNTAPFCTFQQTELQPTFFFLKANARGSPIYTL